MRHRYYYVCNACKRISEAQIYRLMEEKNNEVRRQYYEQQQQEEEARLSPH
jgi:hypothetical protein